MNKKYKKVRGLGELLLLRAGKKKKKKKTIPWEDRKLSWTQIIEVFPLLGEGRITEYCPSPDRGAQPLCQGPRLI